MNETHGGVSPSGYTGSGYGFAQNKLAMTVPLPPAASRPPATGDVQHPQPAPTSTVTGPAPWWKTLGHPQWHGTSMQEPPLGVLGISFRKFPGYGSGIWRAY